MRVVNCFTKDPDFIGGAPESFVFIKTLWALQVTNIPVAEHAVTIVRVPWIIFIVFCLSPVGFHSTIMSKIA